jgi:hypothetical protein
MEKQSLKYLMQLFFCDIETEKQYYEEYIDKLKSGSFGIYQKTWENLIKFLIDEMQEDYKSYLEGSKMIEEEKLRQLPSLFQIKDFDCYEYHQVREIIFNSIEEENCEPTNILDERLIKCLTLKDNKLVAFTSLCAFLYYLFKKKYKCPNILKDLLKNLDAYFDSDDVDFNMNISSEEIIIFKSLKEFLNDEDIKYKLKAYQMCQFFEISLSLTKMLDFTLCYIESKVQKNLVLVWGQTGHGKTTLINYLFGTEYKSVSCETFLIPKKGSYEKFKTTDHESFMFSHTTYCEIEKLTSELTIVDLPGFNEIGPGKIQKSVIAELMLPLLIQKVKNLKAIVIVVGG